MRHRTKPGAAFLAKVRVSNLCLAAESSQAPTGPTGELSFRSKVFLQGVVILTTVAILTNRTLGKCVLAAQIPAGRCCGGGRQ